MLPSIARAVVVSLVVLAGCHRPAPSSRDAEPAKVVDLSDLRRAQLRDQLATHRAEQIARLEAYAAAGQFPHNYDVAPSLHMFRDAGGRYCAVANLVHQDGRDDLVEQTVRARNDLAIADVHDGPMMDWVLASGLTQEELVDVQLPAPVFTHKPAPRKPPAAKGPTPAEVAAAEATMNAIVRAHVAEVEARLRASTDASLDVAVARYLAAFGTS